MLSHLQGLVGGSTVDLGAKVCSSRAGSREVASKDWLNEGAEYNLGAAEGRISSLLWIENMTKLTQ